MSQIPPQPSQVYVASVTPGVATPGTAPHAEANDQEEVYYQGSPMLRGHFGHMFLCTFIGLVLIAVPIVWVHYMKSHMLWWIIISFIAAGIITMIIPMLLVKRTRYRITNYRIDFERGWLSTTIDTLELWHVEDIKFHQSLWEKIVGVGSIAILSHDDTTPNLALHGVPHARQLFTTLEQRIIAVKRQRGVLKVDSGT